MVRTAPRAVGALTAADTSRYQRTRADVVKALTLGIMPAGIALLWAGAVLAVVAGTEDLGVVFVSLGIPVLGIVAVIMSTWPANAGNAYSSGLDGVKLAGLKDHWRAAATVARGLIGVILACFNIIDYFTEVLTYIGIIVTPLCGSMIADHWVSRGADPRRWRPTLGISPAGLISWLAGAGVALTIDWLARHGNDVLAKWAIPSVAGVALAFLAYLLIERALPAREAPYGLESTAN